MKNRVVAAALSGGIDSLVAGYLLKQKYKKIFGIHFTTGYEKDPIDVRLLEKQLGFEVRVVDLSKQFEKKVVKYFIKTYLEGQTPNPCMICNREIKFGVLLDHAKSLGADVLATGHYTTVVNSLSFPNKEICAPYLEKGKDPLKDQSYFLSLVPGRQLDNILFPLAGMTKEKVKQFAKSKGIAPLHPSESQDICFIHDNNFSGFITGKQGITPKAGNIVDMEGTVVGKHQGLHQFTIGQRRGINCPASEPYYVKQIEMKNNLLRVCFKKDLTCSQFSINQINWNFSKQPPINDMSVKIRYSHKEAKAALTFHNTEGNNQKTGEVLFETPQNAVTPGQAAVFYKKERVLGAGIIADTN